MANSFLRQFLFSTAAVSLVVSSVYSTPVAAFDSNDFALGVESFQTLQVAPFSDDFILNQVKREIAASPVEAHRAIIADNKLMYPHLSEELDALLEQQALKEVDISAKGSSAATTAAPVEDISSKEKAESAPQLPPAPAAESGSFPAVVGVAVGGAAIAGGVLALSGGGGSGGGSDKKKKDDPKWENPPPGERPKYRDDPGYYETGEYQANWGLSSIKANEAYARGNSGYGTTVAVVDTGVDVKHPEFKDRIVDPYWSVGDNSDTIHHGDHGTHVAGIIGAARDGKGMHGIAWSANIMPINFGDREGRLFTGNNGSNVGRAWSHAARHGADVVNNSWSLTNVYAGDLSREDWERDYADMIKAAREMKDADVISVFSTGNDRKDQPSVLAALPSEFPELEGHWVAVASVNSYGYFSSFSNACGMAADWCISAPGEDIPSTVSGGGYGNMSGTSMAAPHVAGAIAVLKSAFPHLTAPEISSILFESADDMGDKARFGHGLLNLERATRPLGELVIPLSTHVDGSSVSLGKSSLAVSAAFGDGIGRALEGHSVMALDDYNRAYHLDLSNVASSRPQDSRKDALHRLKLFGGIEERSVTQIDAGPFSITTASRLRASDPSVGYTPYSRMSFGFTGQSYSAEVAMNPDLARDFGFRATGFQDAPMMEGHGFDQAHLGLMETGFGSTLGLALNDTSTLRFGVYSGSVETQDNASLTKAPSMYGAVAELENDFDLMNLRASFGVVSEEGSLLGSLSKGAFGEDMRSTTFFANLGTTIDLTANTRLTLTGSLGHSSFKQSGGLLRSGENILTSSFGAGVSHSALFQEDDVLTLAVSQPLRVESGKVNLSVPTSRSLDGGISYSRASLSPAPSGREINLQASYGFELTEGVETSLGAMHRFNADHVAGRSETVGMVSLSFSF